MQRSSTEILSPARTEIARGRPRAALKELELARAELLANADRDGLSELLELARGVNTLAPADTKARERILTATGEGIDSLAAATVTKPADVPSARTTSAKPPTSYPHYVLVTTEQILAPARYEIEHQNTGRALRLLEKARSKLLARDDLNGLGELLELAQRLPVAKPRHAAQRKRLIEAVQQNIRYLGRGKAIRTGQVWSDPFAAAKPKTKLPSLPPMTRREILVAAAIVVVIAAGITTWALVKRAPQRAVHAIQCPTGEQGGPTWSPDGKEIAFAKNRECGTQITVISLGDGRLRTVSKGYGVLPDWSPDGRTILYRSRDGFSVVPVQGGNSRLLRSDDGYMGASWSPDGKRIAFVHGLDPYQADSGGITYRSTMYTMKPDGSDVLRVLGHSCNPRTPQWSPDGKYLLFGCDHGIYYMTSKGGSIKRIIILDLSFWPVSAKMSPDGRQLLFGWAGLETVPMNGRRDPKVLTAIANSDDSTIDVAWAPDGKRIAFSVTGSGSDDGLYLIDRDGSHRKRLVRF